MLAHGLLHLFALAEAQQPRVDEHAGELLADRTVNERRGDGRIDTAGETTDDLCVTDLFPDACDVLLDECARRPIRYRVAHIEQKVRDDLTASCGMRDFRMELDTEDRLRLV